MKNPIYILGIGHNSPVYYELAESCGFKIAGLYHYDNSRTGNFDHEYPIIGSFDDLFSLKSLEGMSFALSQGDNRIRQELFDRILEKGGDIPILIHPSAQVSRFADLGKGVVIHIMAIIHPDTAIGDNTVISFNSSISHTTTIGKHCYIAGGSLIGSYTDVRDFVFIGLSVTTLSNKVPYIGNNSYIGAGSLVTKSVEENTIVKGIPARIITLEST